MRSIICITALSIASACATTPAPAPSDEQQDGAGATVAARADRPPTREEIEGAEQDFLRGRALATEGRHAEALPLFEAAARAYPSWALAHLEEARCRMVLNQREEQIRPALERALTLASANPRVHYAWGLFHESFGRDGPARVSYRQAVVLRDSYGEALYRLALLEELGGARRTALDYFERAYRSDPDNVGAALGAARLAEAVGEPKRAEQLLRQLVRRFPSQLGYQRQLVELLRRTGQHRKARRLQAKIDRADASRERELRPLRPSRR